MKNKIFLDDKRSFDEAKKSGYQCVTNYSYCTILLDMYKNNLETVNLDYDLGTEKTGLDILIYMKENEIIPKEIIVHSTHSEGVKKMEKYIEDNFSTSNYLYCPM